MPSARDYHTAVWTGSEMIVWGGRGQGSLQDPCHYFATGGRYNPLTDTWVATSLSNVPAARSYHTAIWDPSGARMIVWGGERWDGNSCNPYNAVATGGIYSPATDTWISTFSAPLAGRSRHVAVWAGSEMIVWGGFALSGISNVPVDGARLLPGAAGWRYIAGSSSNGPPSARFGHTAVWTGTEMIVWGGQLDFFKQTGGRFEPATATWTPTAVGSGTPSPRVYHTAVWTGSQMIVWWDRRRGSRHGRSLRSGGRRLDQDLHGRWGARTARAPHGRVDGLQP